MAEALLSLAHKFLSRLVEPLLVGYVEMYLFLSQFFLSLLGVSISECLPTEGIRVKQKSDILSVITSSHDTVNNSDSTFFFCFKGIVIDGSCS